jgi:hypothetical protein
MEVGVPDEAAGASVASLMMGEPSPESGSERTAMGGSVLRYLRAFKASESAVWVDFSITYDQKAEAETIVEWLLKALKQYGGPMTLRLDTTEVPVESGAMSALIRTKIKEAL